MRMVQTAIAAPFHHADGAGDRQTSGRVSGIFHTAGAEPACGAGGAAVGSGGLHGTGGGGVRDSGSGEDSGGCGGGSARRWQTGVAGGAGAAGTRRAGPSVRPTSGEAGYRCAGVTAELAGERLPEREYDWVVDATGWREGLASAVRMTRPRGTVILKSTV